MPPSPHLDDAAVRRLAAGFAGDLIAPDSPGYDEARRLWNRMIDRRPALVARCAGAQDARRAVAFAREHDLPISVRGGGHNVSGSALVDGGVVVTTACGAPCSSIRRPGWSRSSRAPSWAIWIARPPTTTWPCRSASTRRPASPAWRWAAGSGG